MAGAGCDLLELDKLTVTVVVDNVTDCLSPPIACCDSKSTHACCHYVSEINQFITDIKAGRAKEIDFHRFCYAGHGLSLYITAHVGDMKRTLVFDAGPNGSLWEHNMESLGLPSEDIEAVVLSHWHIDHSNGLPQVAAAISKARQQQQQLQGKPAQASSSGSTAADAAMPPCVMDLHPKRPFRRGLQLAPDNVVPFNQDPTLEELQQEGVEVRLHGEEHLLLGGAFYVSGFIPRVTPYEEGNPMHASQWEEGGEWVPDPELEDERFLMARVKGIGPVVFSACSHAGIVNVVKAATAAAGATPTCIMGGFHLAPRDCWPRIEPTVADLGRLGPEMLVLPGHCTGWRAMQALTRAFPETCMPCSVGSTYEFKSPSELTS